MPFILTLLVAIVAALIALLPVIGPDLSKKGHWKGHVFRHWKPAFIICIFLAVSGTVHEYLTARRELFRLSPTDIQLRLRSEATVGRNVVIENQPIRFGVNGTIGNMIIITEFERVSERIRNPMHPLHPMYDARVHGLRPVGSCRFDYFAIRTTLSGLENYPFLNDLDDMRFSCHLPLKDIQTFGSNWNHHIDLYIMGRHFAGKADSTGMVSIIIDL